VGNEDRLTARDKKERNEEGLRPRSGRAARAHRGRHRVHPQLGTDLGETAGEDAEDCDVSAYTMGVKWQQQSAEAAALQGQTYELTAGMLDLDMAAAPEVEDLAGMNAVDETTIDNSKLVARDIEKCHDFSGWDTWDDWEKNGGPRMIPGAVE